MSVRDELIELIEEVDQINVDSLPVLQELVSWLPAHTIESFIEDARAVLELDSPEEEDDIEYPVQGPNWPSADEDTTDLDIDPETEIYDEDYFFNEGVKAAEALKKERIERYLQLVQCSEV